MVVMEVRKRVHCQCFIAYGKKKSKIAFLIPENTRKIKSAKKQNNISQP